MNLRNYTVAGFDRGAPKWLEILWILSQCALFMTPIPYPSSVKAAVLRSCAAKVGRRVVIGSLVNISFPWRLEIGDDVWIGDGVWILSLARITVESNVCISQRSYLCSGTHDYRKKAPEERLIESLLAAHVMVATQKPVVWGLLWPCKLGLIMALPRPIIFIGAKNGAIALELSSKCNARVFAPGDAQSLADHIQAAYQSWPPDLVPDIRPTFDLSEAVGLWKVVLENAVQPPKDQLTGCK
jgi:hypothetical protein